MSIDIGAELAVQSFCFRSFKDNAQVADIVLECGLDRIELCGVHADFTQPEAFERIADVYRRRGVRIVSIGVQTFKADRDLERRYFECARIAGARHLSANFAIESIPKSFEVAAELAEEFGVRLGIHNHGGHHWLGNSQTLAWVFRRTSPAIGLCLDTAWAIDAGIDPIAMARQFRDRLYGIHFKDFEYDRMRKHRDVIVGTGILDLPGLLTFLRDADFAGCPILEYEGYPDDPAPALKECVDAIRSSWSAVASG